MDSNNIVSLIPLQAQEILFPTIVGERSEKTQF